MNIVTIVEPPVEPVSVAEVYEFLRWDAEDFDGVPPEPEGYPLQTTIERNIRTARIWVEQATRRALVQQTLRMSLGAVEHATLTGFGRIGGWGKPRAIELLRPPVASIIAVSYYDHLNAPQLIDAANYFVADDYVPQLCFIDAWNVPCLYDRPDAFRVTYVAGYAPSLDSPADYTLNVPAPLKDAICLQVQLLTDRFDANEKRDIERTRDDLISSFRVHTF